MRKLVVLGLLAVVASCDHEAFGPDPRLYPPEANLGITDALHNLGNPHFFWLAPVVAQPPASEFGTFDAAAVPTVRLLCEDAMPAANCPGEQIGAEIAEFTLGTGVRLESDHYQLDFDTKIGHGVNGDVFLRPSTVSDYTTYQFVVELSHPQFGTLVIGDVSFQLGATGGDLKSLSTDETIALKDGRVFPLKMRIDEDALEYAVVQDLFDAGAFAGDPDFGVGGAPCQVNCALHLIPEQTAYTAYLHKTGVPYAVTGVQFDDTALEFPTAVELNARQQTEGEASAVAIDPNTFLVIIDERVTENDMAGQENCALGIDTDKWYCYRYLIHPNVQFQHEVPVGICPEEVDLSTHRLLRADYDANGNPILSRPALVDVSGFLPCEAPEVPQDQVGMLIGAARSTFDWLFPPLFAQTLVRRWGGMADDFSDWFLGVDTALPQPNLGVSLTHLPAQPTDLDAISVAATVVNDGDATARSSTLRLLLNGVETLVQVPILRPGQQFQHVQQQGALAEGDYSNTATADHTLVVTETSEDDNTATDAFGVVPPPDLEVISMTHAPATPTTAQTATFTATVSNVGESTAGPSTLMFKLGGETAGLQQTLFEVPALAPGESHTATRTWQPPITAQGYINTAIADFGNVVNESDEQNNTQTDNYLVVAPTGSLVDDVGDVNEGHPDIDRVDIAVSGADLVLEIRFHSGFDPSTASVSWSLDTDQNATTGYPGITGEPDPAPVIGLEYAVRVEGGEYGAEVSVLQYSGGWSSQATGITRDLLLDVTGAPIGYRVAVPLSLLGSDDGRLNFKASVSNHVTETSFTSRLDDVSDLDEAPGSTSP